MPRHMKDKHGVPIKDYAQEPEDCGICGKTFKHKVSMRMHFNKVHAKKLYHKCNYCPYTTPDSYRMMLHFKSLHSVDKPKLRCHICDHPGFEAHSGLYSHIQNKHHEGAWLEWKAIDWKHYDWSKHQFKEKCTVIGIDEKPKQKISFGTDSNNQ